jgi:hypothetical protein
MDISQMPPEVLAQLMSLLTQQEEDADLQAQLQQAQQLQHGAGKERYGPAAGALQMGADLLNAYKGRKAAGNAQTKREKLRQGMQETRQNVANWYNTPPPQPALPDPVAPLVDIEAEQAQIPPNLRRPRGG